MVLQVDRASPPPRIEPLGAAIVLGRVLRYSKKIQNFLTEKGTM